jgi:hypothetical protein
MVLFEWLAERLRDAAAWPINLVRDFPHRLGRVLFWLWSTLSGLWGFFQTLFQAKPEGWSAWAHHWAGRLVFAGHQLFCYLFDLLGGPELAQFLMHLVMPTTSLTVTEMAAAATVLGPTALRYGEVRVAEGGLLRLIFRLNRNRAFALWHTIHLPQCGRADLSLLVHEITHVFQYEKIGSIYIGEALYAQWTLGRGAYQYGGADGLKRAYQSGKPYKAYTREQQAQIAQDYYQLLAQSTHPADQSTIYELYIQDLRKGKF